MVNQFIEDFKKLLKKRGLASIFSIRGCSEKEIQILESHFNLKLPVIYRDFLLTMGHKAGKYGQGTDMFYDDLFSNRDGFQELLEEDKFPFNLEHSFFVFAAHQGYTYLFFNVEEDAIDPPVYCYKEGEHVIKRIYDSFSEFLMGDPILRNNY